MKIGIVGNCQTNGLARCLRVMAPECEVVAAQLGIDAIEAVSGSDVVAIQSGFQNVYADQVKMLSDQGATILTWPTFNFPAFHPDLVYVWQDGRPVQSPLSDYHSSIVFAAWQQGIPVQTVPSLFNERLFGRLGFFDYWDQSKLTSIEDMAATGLHFGDVFARWQKSGCFAYSMNHPKLTVLGSYASALLNALGIRAVTERPEDVLHDLFRDSAIWPVYPEIASRLAVEGSYLFKAAGISGEPGAAARILDLEKFIIGSYQSYDAAGPGALRCDRVTSQADSYADLASYARVARPSRGNPYSALPDYCFWRKAVAAPVWDQIDPVVSAKFTLAETDRIATAGSCFAQHIARTLLASGYNYHVAEAPPRDMPAEKAKISGYGLFSARFGNIYTARQLMQLLDRAFGDFVPADRAWQRADGRFIDPFRPQVEPDGFASREDVAVALEAHLSSVRHLFQTLDVFIFTVGLTEAWRATVDGAVFPVAPGVVAAGLPEKDYAFVNFTAGEVEADLRLFAERLQSINPTARIILTVSPVPLIATYENQHVLLSTTYSKSALRVAVGQLAQAFDNVAYFPSYEIITGNFTKGRYFESDLREVRPEGVDHVMRLFKHHFFSASPRTEAVHVSAVLRREIADNSVILCDEELLDSSSPPTGS